MLDLRKVELRKRWLLACAVAGSLLAFQRPFREYPGIEYDNFPLPPDAQEKTEFAFARLMYPPAPTAMFDRAGPRWAEGMSSWTQDYPRADRQAVELENSSPIFHTTYDLDERYQVTGAWGLYGRGYQNDGKEAHWKGIFDDKGRLMVAITMNSDLGDSWEWADSAEYPERYSALGIRIGVNYVVYALTQ
jgi:hypothetical protein